MIQHERAVRHVISTRVGAMAAARRREDATPAASPPGSAFASAAAVAVAGVNELPRHGLNS